MALRGVLDHPKFGALKSLLKLNKYATLGLLEALWHFTARYTPAGNIGKYTDQEIAMWLEWPGDATALISALIASRWIDTEEHYRLIVHDWPDSADEAVHGQLARRLERFANGELPRTRRLNSGERKKYNDAVVAGEEVIRERIVPSIPAMTVQGALPSRAGYVQGSGDARSVLSPPCTTIAVPVPVPVPEPVPEPDSEKTLVPLALSAIADDTLFSHKTLNPMRVIPFEKTPTGQDKDQWELSTYLEFWNAACARFKRAQMTDRRVAKLQALIGDGMTTQEFMEAVRKVASSEKCKNIQNWTPNFDWFLSDSNWHDGRFACTYI